MDHLSDFFLSGGLVRGEIPGGEPVNGAQFLGGIPSFVEGAGGALIAGAAEVVHQKVASHGGDPHLEAAAIGVEAGKVGVDLEEHVLCEVFGVGGVAREAVAEALDTAVVGANQFSPRAGIPFHAETDDLGPVNLQRITLHARRANDGGAECP